MKCSRGRPKPQPPKAAKQASSADLPEAQGSKTQAGKVAEEHETEDESNEPELVAWRQETWENIQKIQNAGTVEKIWAYWEFPGKGHSDNIEVNMYISIVSV